jgi:hypothetical protein
MTAVDRPDKAFDHDRVAFTVDVEASAVYEPRPGSLHDPALAERLQATGVNIDDHFDSYVMVLAVLDERALGKASGAVTSAESLVFLLFVALTTATFGALRPQGDR